MVEFRFAHRAYFLAQNFSVIEFWEMIVDICAEFVVAGWEFLEELVHQEGNVINHVVADNRLLCVGHQLHDKTEAHLLSPQMFHLRSLKGRQVLGGVVVNFLV